MHDRCATAAQQSRCNENAGPARAEGEFDILHREKGVNAPIQQLSPRDDDRRVRLEWRMNHAYSGRAGVERKRGCDAAAGASEQTDRNANCNREYSAEIAN